MARWDIYTITAQENVDTTQWMGSKFSPEEKQRIENGVDNRLMEGNQILNKDMSLGLQRENNLFKIDNDDSKTIDADRKRGLAIKKADEDDDGHLEVHEYDKHKDMLSQAFVEWEKERKNPIIQQFEESKKNYYADLDHVWSSEKKLLFNEVGDQLLDAKNSIVAGNANKDMIAWNARNEISANNAVNIVASNGKTPEEFATTDPFSYARVYQEQWNRQYAMA